MAIREKSRTHVAEVFIAIIFCEMNRQVRFLVDAKLAVPNRLPLCVGLVWNLVESVRGST